MHRSLTATASWHWQLYCAFLSFQFTVFEKQERKKQKKGLAGNPLGNPSHVLLKNVARPSNSSDRNRGLGVLSPVESSERVS